MKYNMAALSSGFNGFMRLAWLMAFFVMAGWALQGVKDFSRAIEVEAKEKTVQAVFLSSEPKAYRVQKDSIIANYLRD